MQIVIDIDEEIFNKLPEAEFGSNIIEDVLEAVENGTVLPKEHGNLFDENDFEKRIAIMTELMDLGYGEIMDIIDEIPTIIEADKRK